MYIKISERNPTGNFETYYGRIRVEEAYECLKNIARDININGVKVQEQEIGENVKLIHIWLDDDIIILVDDIDHELHYRIRCYGLTDKTYNEVRDAAIVNFGC